MEREVREYAGRQFASCSVGGKHRLCNVTGSIEQGLRLEGQASFVVHPSARLVKSMLELASEVASD